MPISPTEIRNWTIYKITSPTGRIYIGITHREKSRKNCYKYSACKDQPVIYNSILKYGWDNHKYEVIDTFSQSKQFAEGKEMFWIRSYMSNVSRYPEQRGMNLNDGGGLNIGFKHSEESKRKMSVNGSGYKWSEESKIKFSEKKKGFNSYWPNEETLRKMSIASKGRVASDETKEKMSQVAKNRVSPNKGKPMKESQKEKYFKPIMVYSLDMKLIKECRSVKDAAKEFNVSKNSIRNISNGATKAPFKFIFKYK